MLALTDRQLDAVMTLARALDPEKRGAYLQWIASRLQQRAGRFTDDDVRIAAEAALASLSTTRRDASDANGMPGNAPAEAAGALADLIWTCDTLRFRLCA